MGCWNKLTDEWIISKNVKSAKELRDVNSGVLPEIDHRLAFQYRKFAYQFCSYNPSTNQKIVAKRANGGCLLFGGKEIYQLLFSHAETSDDTL